MALLESIYGLFSTLPSATQALEFIQQLISKSKGKKRRLLAEIKHNLRACQLVIEFDAEPLKVIPELKTETYDRLMEEGFDFNSLRYGKVRRTKKLAASDLAPLIGKNTAYLVENIYDRIKHVQFLYRFFIVEGNDPQTEKVQWRRRIINIYKRIALLLDHLKKGEK